jgi:hypothetical protein
MSEHAGELSPDFAERVLQLADRRLAERRRMRWVAAATGLCAVIGTISWINFAAAPQQGGVSPRNTMFVDRSAPSADEMPGNSDDALSYFFPDAEPLDRFAAEEGEGDNGLGAESLFNDQN